MTIDRLVIFFWGRWGGLVKHLHYQRICFHRHSFFHVGGLASPWPKPVVEDFASLESSNSMDGLEEGQRTTSPWGRVLSRLVVGQLAVQWLVLPSLPAPRASTPHARCDTPVET